MTTKILFVRIFHRADCIRRYHGKDAATHILDKGLLFELGHRDQYGRRTNRHALALLAGIMLLFVFVSPGVHGHLPIQLV